MLSKAVLAAVLFSSAAVTAIPAYTRDALKDEITDLPGQPAGVNFKQFSGYVPLENDKTKQMFYWMVEADMPNPSKAPLILWTNGGPGCSGLGGFLTEQGPFRPNKNGTLSLNDHRWNKVANMVFIEQPLGVGFSYTTNPMNYGDDQAAMDNYHFILGFLEKYPAYKNNDFYLTSESYGGHYLPTLAKKLVDLGGVKFAGFAVGNPLTYMPYRDYGQYGTYSGHNLLPAPLVQDYVDAGCRKDDSSEDCQNIQGKMDELTNGLNPYALDFPVCMSELAAGREERRAFMNSVYRSKAEKAGNKMLGDYFPDYQPCDDNYALAYLNRADVQSAIHAVPPKKGWSECDMTVNAKYNMTDVVQPMMPIYDYLIKKTGGKLKMMVYSGDDDAVCATLGSQEFIWNLGQKIESPWKQWKLNGQVGGYRVVFNGLEFVTVHGAGHMVPATRPEQSLYVLSQFLSGGDW